MAYSMRGDEIASDLVSSRQMKELEQRFPVRHVFPELEAVHTVDIPDLWDKWEGGSWRPVSLGSTSCLVTRGLVDKDLCQLCCRIFTKEVIFTLHKQPLLYQRYRHHSKLDDLYHAACSGCQICSILWTYIYGKDEYIAGFGDREKFEYLTFTVTKHDHEELYYTLDFIYKGNTREWDRFNCGRVQICLVPKRAIHDQISDPAPPQGPIPETRLQFAARCLDKCSKQHTKCATHLNYTKWRPTRLVDLGSLEGPLEPKLVEFPNNSSESSEPYATVSHRWGSANVFKLMSETLESISKTINVRILPKIYQDAFSAVRKLGLRYVWIDSLCIIQDSHEDWQRESSMMANVYRLAEFNISATGAFDSTGGLYPGTKFSIDRPRKIELLKSYTWDPGEYYILNPRLWSFGISETPLNKRGWVFQERVLARRVLHFGREQLYFECREMDTCEIFPNGIPNIRAFQTRVHGLASNGRFKRQDPNIDGVWLRETNSMGRLTSNPTLNAYSLWSELVEAYSMMDLTNVGDKLIAISGVAKDMRQTLNDQYLAGLWRRHLPYHLLWTKRRDIPMNTESINYIAPSWSWASIHEKVTLYPITDSDHERIVIDITSAETFPAADDDTGQIVGGYIRLTAFLRKCRIARCRLYTNPTESWQIRQSPPRLWLDHKDPCRIYVWPDELDNIHLDESPDSLQLGEVYCMPVHIWWTDEGDCSTEGLILMKASWYPGKWEEGIYKRFGRFKIALANTRDTEDFYGLSPQALIQRLKDGADLPLEKLEISIV